MTPLHQAAQMALDALTSHQDLLGTMHLRMDAIAAAPAPAAPVVPDLKHCACEFDGDTCVTQCKLHAAHVDAIHEWAERAKAAEANMLAAPVVPSAHWRYATMSSVPLPRPGPLGLIQYAGSDMQEYAAAVSAEKDKEIAALRERVAALDDDREAMYKALVDLDELHTKAAEITLAAIRPQGVEGIDAARAKVCADCNEAADGITGGKP